MIHFVQAVFEWECKCMDVPMADGINRTFTIYTNDFGARVS